MQKNILKSLAAVINKNKRNSAEKTKRLCGVHPWPTRTIVSSKSAANLVQCTTSYKSRV